MGQTKKQVRFASRLVLAAAFGSSAACGGGTTTDAPQDSSGGTLGGGGAAASGGAAATGGAVASGGAGIPSGGASSGTGGIASGSGGAPSSGGHTAVGGSGVGGSSGSGGVPSSCECEAPEVPVCGIDGQPYSIACGEVCVPVNIACYGECPCEVNPTCSCTPNASGPGNCSDGSKWICAGSEFDPQDPLDQDCEALPTSDTWYCCPDSVGAADLCPP